METTTINGKDTPCLVQVRRIDRKEFISHKYDSFFYAEPQFCCVTQWGLRGASNPSMPTVFPDRASAKQAVEDALVKDGIEPNHDLEWVEYQCGRLSDSLTVIEKKRDYKKREEDQWSDPKTYAYQFYLIPMLTPEESLESDQQHMSLPITSPLSDEERYQKEVKRQSKSLQGDAEKVVLLSAEIKRLTDLLDEIGTLAEEA